MALVQTTAGNRPVFKLDDGDFSVEFNVSDEPQYLVAPVPSGLAGATQYTFAFWCVRRDNWSANLATPLFGVFPNGGSTTAGGGLSVDTNNDQVRFSPAGSVPSGELEFSINMIPRGEWHHIAGVQTETHRFLYLDGVEIDSRSESGAMPSDLSALSVCIGAAPDGERPIAMQASNLQIWNIALTEQQIQEWAMVRLPDDDLPAGLIGYWPL